MRDKFFPPEDGVRLAELLPKGRLERVENARTFVQLYAPDRVAELIGELLAEPASSTA